MYIRLNPVRLRWVVLLSLATAISGNLETASADDYREQVQPVFAKYCVGCHNRNDREGELSLISMADIRSGGENGVVVVAGDSAQSRIYALMSGADEPAMPPADEPQPTLDEIALIKQWIDAGAQGEDGGVTTLDVPQLAASSGAKPITALAFRGDGQRLALARFQSLDLMTDDRRLVHRLDDHPGKINSVAFSRDGKLLAAATGITGLNGEVWLWDVESGVLQRKISAHRDSIYAVAFSPDGRLLATGAYDRDIHIWNVADGRLLRTLKGHNGPVYGLAFHPNGRILASASGDTTIKIWDVHVGKRLDTRGEPLREQLSVDISADGRLLIAGGADNRLRLWQLVSTEEAKINPLDTVRFAHEEPIQAVRFALEDRIVVSVAADQTVKTWNTRNLTPLATHRQRSQMAPALAVHPVQPRLLIGSLDGMLESIEISTVATENSPTDHASLRVAARNTEEVELIATEEMEPNDEQAQPVSLPTRISGKIFRSAVSADTDRFRFSAKQGEQWVIEVNAARQGSSLDSVIRVLDTDGRSVPRVKLQAVRDSYFTFRGKNSSTTGDFRLHNWEEMRLNQLLYASGEVVKFYHYPRGPDSGFNVYPNFGARHGYFETTPIAHALHEPCYIVEPIPLEAEPPPSGLPTFTLNYRNDDESRRRWGSDSLLTFTAPFDGDYVVELQDVRRLQQETHGYELTIRRPSPRFELKPVGELNVPLGAGARFMVEIDRWDGFDGEVRIDVEDVPAGLQVTTPIVVEAGQLRAWGAVLAGQEAAEIKDVQLTLRATGTDELGAIIERSIEAGPIHVGDPTKVRIELVGHEVLDDGTNVLELHPGTSGTALIRIQRDNHEGRVGFGKEDALVNSPHGVFVSNTGLNGVLITESQTERSIFINVEPWVKPMERWVFVQAGIDGNPTSLPVLLRILPSDNSQAVLPSAFKIDSISSTADASD